MDTKNVVKRGIFTVEDYMCLVRCCLIWAKLLHKKMITNTMTTTMMMINDAPRFTKRTAGLQCNSLENFASATELLTYLSIHAVLQKAGSPITLSCWALLTTLVAVHCNPCWFVIHLTTLYLSSEQNSAML